MDDATSKQSNESEEVIEHIDADQVESGIESVEEARAGARSRAEARDEVELVSPQEIQEQAKAQMNQASELLDLEQSIKTYYQGAQMKREEMKQYKEMIADTFANDKTLAESEEKMKALKMESNKIREQLAGTSAVIEAKQKLKELSDEVKELDKTLSKFLLQYREIAQTNQIMVKEGEIYQIVQSAKLVKQTAASRD